MDIWVPTFLRLLDEQNRTASIAFWSDLEKHIPDAKGSTASHQAWNGGYRDHVQEVMNIGATLHLQLNKVRPLEFTLESALLVLFLHDCEKPFKNATDQQLKAFPWIKKRPGKSDKNFQKQLIDHYGFHLSATEWNALKYVEGENEDYVQGKRVQGPLGAFCHVCDTVSARIWHDYPKNKV